MSFSQFKVCQDAPMVKQKLHMFFKINILQLWMNLWSSITVELYFLSSFSLLWAASSKLHRTLFHLCSPRGYGSQSEVFLEVRTEHLCKHSTSGWKILEPDYVKSRLSTSCSSCGETPSYKWIVSHGIFMSTHRGCTLTGCWNDYKYISQISNYHCIT